MKTKEPGEQHAHLKNAIIYVIIWLVVFAIEALMYKRAGGFAEMLASAEDRFSFLLVFALSVFMMALAIRSFFLYLRHDK